MKINKFILHALFLLFLCTATAKGNDIFDEISFSIKSGNASELASFFGQRIELTILTSENVYSRRQAEVVVREFFNENTPSDFEVIHQGASNNKAHYAIGLLETSNGNFRTYLFIKEEGGRYRIKEVRFEEE